MFSRTSCLRRPAIRAAAILLTAAAATAAIPSSASAHPTLNISASPTTVPAGTTVTLTISGTSNGNYTNARIEVSAGSGTGGTTGTLTSFTSDPTCGTGTPSTPTCSEITNKYKLYPINLTNSQAFSYTITFTVDDTTAVGTFKANAQFYKSDDTTDGLTTGPTITVTPATSDLVLTKTSAGFHDSRLTLSYGYTNNGPGDTSSPVAFSATVTPAGFASSIDSVCETGESGQDTSCSLSSIPASTSGSGTVTFHGVGLLTLGTWTVSITMTSDNESNPADNTVTWTCTVVTLLLANCT